MPMRILNLFLLLSLVLVGPMLMAQSSVSGTWEGEVQGRNGTQTVTFTFSQEGATLTGKVSSPRGDQNIEDGKVEGDQISFKTTAEFNGNTMAITYSGKISGDQIAFKREFGQSGRTSEFTAKRKM
jgi:hypothetical protein